jgi:hypothetical protein
VGASTSHNPVGLRGFTFTVAILITAILYVHSVAEGGDTQRASTDNTVRDVATLLFQVDFVECQPRALLVTATFICCETTVTGSNVAFGCIMQNYTAPPPPPPPLVWAFQSDVQPTHPTPHELKHSSKLGERLRLCQRHREDKQFLTPTKEFYIRGCDAV